MTTPDTTESTGKSPSVLVTGAVILVLSICGAGGGWLVGTMLQGVSVTGQGDETAGTYADMLETSSEEDVARSEAALPNIMQLEPITTNLSYPRESWVRLEVAAVFDGEADPILAETIHQDLLAYLRTVSLQQIEGPRGFHHLRDDLTERAALRSEGRVTALLFRTFLVE